MTKEEYIKQGKKVLTLQIDKQYFQAILKGEQKITILSYLSSILDNHFYENEANKDYLFNCLCHTCNIAEKLSLQLWFKLKDTSKYKSKSFNFCVRIFRING